MYWLKTFNNLIHSKEFFSSMDKLLVSLKNVIKESEIKERQFRTTRVKDEFDLEVITLAEKMSKLEEIKKWNGFSINELIADPEDKNPSHMCSVVVCKCKEECIGRFLLGKIGEKQS